MSGESKDTGNSITFFVMKYGVREYIWLADSRKNTGRSI